MFSALKRFAKPEGATSSYAGSGGIGEGKPPQSLSSSLQKRFSKGVQYNMKIVLKGDHNSGKSSCFRRLQGLPFDEKYVPTDEIQVTNIHWSYKTNDDVVKVEIWDVVDKAKTKRQFQGKLKINNNVSNHDPSTELGLDATFVDVYKSTNGVILLLDITKPWTFDYVKREISVIPKSIPILILGNHRDMGHPQQAVTSDSVQYFIASLDRDNTCAQVRFAECSMKNGFGLKLIHKFFNLPFLQLQKETLLQQLETNKRESLITLQELDFYSESTEADYETFMKNLGAKRFPTVETNSAAASHVDPGSTGSNPMTGKNGLNLQESVENANAIPEPSLKTSLTNASIPQEKGKILSQPGASVMEPNKNVIQLHENTTSVIRAFEFRPDENTIENRFFQDEQDNDKAVQKKGFPVKLRNDSSEGDDNDERESNPMVNSYLEDVCPEQYNVPCALSPQPVSSSEISDDDSECKSFSHNKAKTSEDRQLEGAINNPAASSNSNTVFGKAVIRKTRSERKTKLTSSPKKIPSVETLLSDSGINKNTKADNIGSYELI